MGFIILFAFGGEDFLSDNIWNKSDSPLEKMSVCVVEQLFRPFLQKGNHL